MYKFAIIGLGHISQYYIAAINKNPDISLVALCDKNKKNDVYKQLNAPFYTNYKKMLEANDLDAVVILTPNYTHCEIARYAINKKINVLCEKPLGATVEECKQNIALAEVKKIILFTAFHRRFNKNFLQLKKHIDLQQNLQSICVRYFEDINKHSGGENWYFNPKKSGGGCVMDNGINVFDLILNFVSDPVIKSVELLYKNDGIDVKALIKLTDQAANVDITVYLDWISENEIKDILIKTSEGSLGADLLSGFPAFKESLWHEYEGVITEFVNLLRTKKCAFVDERNLKAMRLVEDTYDLSKISCLASLR